MAQFTQDEINQLLQEIALDEQSAELANQRRIAEKLRYDKPSHRQAGSLGEGLLNSFGDATGALAGYFKEKNVKEQQGQNQAQRVGTLGQYYDAVQSSMNPSIDQAPSAQADSMRINPAAFHSGSLTGQGAQLPPSMSNDPFGLGGLPNLSPDLLAFLRRQNG